jgi:hypothetical protein
VSLLSVLVMLGYALGAIGGATAVVALVGVNGFYLCASLAFMALYLARIYHNGLRRTRFIVDWSCTALARESGPLARGAAAAAHVRPAAPTA